MRKKSILALGIALTLAITSPALAEKPSWPGSEGKSGKHGQKEKHENKGGQENGSSQDHRGNEGNANHYFDDHHRNVILNYYTDQYRSGNCPPGLAKKNNGCMPPGQAKKWQVGRPLPRDVVYHDLPPAIIVQLGSPPARHRYVRVAADILLIAVGTGMVVDAIQDLSRN